jgi:hypothetical protein
MALLSFLPKRAAKPKRKPKPAKARAAKKANVPLKVQAPIPLPSDLKHRLNALRLKSRLVAVGTGLSMLLGAVSLLLLAQGVSDWWFDLPWAARAGFLSVDFVILIVVYRAKLDGALRKRLSMSEAALLAEKKWPQLKQSVIAAVELTEGKPYSTRGSRQLVDIVLQQARARTTNLNFKDVVRTRGLRNWAIAGGLAFLAAAGTAALTWPASLTLLERIFLINVPLPTKTIVVAITRDLIVPVGSDVEISAQAQGIIPSHGRVTIAYADVPTQEFPVVAVPDKPGVFSLTVHNVQNPFKYTFYLNDGHGSEFTVTAKVPPSLTDLQCQQYYPDYTGLPPQKLAPTQLSLLAGSRLMVDATSLDPLKSAKVILQGTNQTVDATLDPTGTHLEADIPIPARDLTGFSIHLVDQAGVSSANDTVYPIVLVPDNPPVVKIVEPTEDKETVTLRAKPVIAFTASDDYGLAQLTIKYQMSVTPVAGQVSTGPPAQVHSIPIKVKKAGEGQDYEYELDIGTQNPPWQEGQAVNYWVEAIDNNTATGPGTASTDHKEFDIISVAAKREEIMERIKKNVGEIDDISGTQTKIKTDVDNAIPQK